MTNYKQCDVIENCTGIVIDNWIKLYDTQNVNLFYKDVRWNNYEKFWI